MLSWTRHLPWQFCSTEILPAPEFPNTWSLYSCWGLSSLPVCQTTWKIDLWASNPKILCPIHKILLRFIDCPTILWHFGISIGTDREKQYRAKALWISALYSSNFMVDTMVVERGHKYSFTQQFFSENDSKQFHDHEAILQLIEVIFLRFFCVTPSQAGLVLSYHSWTVPL